MWAGEGELKTSNVVVCSLALGAGLMLGNATSQAAEISVMSTVAYRDAYLELLPAFERASGHKVTTQWLPTVEVLRRIKGGETVDLVLMAAGGIDELASAGKIVAGSKAAFVKSGIGIAARAGAVRPDVGSIDGFKRTLLSAKSVAYSTGPSGNYLVGLFERLGITAEIKAKTRLIQGEPVGDVVARGDAEIGFQQIPEILPVKGIQYLGPLPPEIQFVTVFAAGLHAAAKQGEAARAWVAFLKSPDAAALYRKFGMEPD
jgi:molybdate transport system substrate-binding protein